jgi:ComF family protein
MPDGVLCDACTARVEIPQIIYKTIDQYVVPIYAASAYTQPIQALVGAKERKHVHAARQLGRVVAEYAKQHELVFDYIIPVPLYWMRRCIRGYNQAVVMAELVQAYHTHAQVIHLFRRVRATHAQKTLDAEARHENVKNAFARSWRWSEHACGVALQGKKVVLIDDVYTTGATIEALVHVVAQYKPASITVLVGCRVS